MALKLVRRGAVALTVPAGARGQWLSNNIYSYHRMTGLYLMTVEMTGTNAPNLNIRGGSHGTYGDTWDKPTQQHITLDEQSQIIIVGSGEGDGKTTVSFIKIGDAL